MCSLKPIDIAFMKAMDRKVNMVPVIAKADTLSRAEMTKLKGRVSNYCNWLQFYQY